MAKRMTEIEQRGDAQVVTVSGKIDLQRSPVLHKEMLDLCASTPAHILMLLKDVSYIDSSGVGTLVDIARKVKSYSGRLTLVAPAKRVRAVFEITRLDQYFEIVDSMDEVLPDAP